MTRSGEVVASKAASVFIPFRKGKNELQDIFLYVESRVMAQLEQAVSS
jgi:hypothetical protein